METQSMVQFYRQAIDMNVDRGRRRCIPASAE
jgi:hypothetical protein